MQRAQQDYWRKRFEKLKAENLSLKEKLSGIKKENNSLKKVLRNKEKLFHSIPAGVVLVQEGKIIDINRLALEHLGYRAEEVIDHHFLDFVHPDLKEFMRDLHRKRVAGRRVPSLYETDVLTKSGERVCCEARVSRVRFHGRRAFLVNLTRLEKRKKREKELIQSKKREALTAMASGLTRKLTHDLRGVPEDILHIKDMADSENRALMDGLENIEAASCEIINTSRKLESLLRTEDGPSARTPFDLRNTVKEAVSLTSPKLKELAERGKLKINVKTYLRSVSPVEGNPDEIRDLVIHLIMNAVEAMPRGGDLYLTTEENAGYAHIYIQDSGVGIADPIKDRVLDPFFTTKGRERVGLGLSMSHAIVKRHKGEMELASQKDQGTTCTIRLPLAGQDKTSTTGPSKRKIKNANILIIEDGAILRELLSQVLVSKGHRVKTAASALEGLHQLRRKEFHLVLADFEMPDMAGEVLVQKIRKVKQELPIALLAGQEAAGQSRPPKGSAADLIIRKPLDMNRVLSQVEGILRQRGGHGPL